MKQALEIVNKYIHAFDGQLDDIVTYEVKMSELECLTTREAERCNREWIEAYSKRALLITIRDEIKQSMIQ